MALHLHGADITTIKKLGRWTSKTFEDCIHIQIGSFSSGLSSQMAHDIPFQQIAPPRHLESAVDVFLQSGTTAIDVE